MRAKYQAEVDQLRAEMKDKLAEVKSHELENGARHRTYSWRVLFRRSKPK